MNKILWTFNGSEDERIIVEEKEIETVVDCYDQSICKITNVPAEAEVELGKALKGKELSSNEGYFDDIKTFLKQQGYPNADVKYLSDYPYPEDVLCFDFNLNVFFNLGYSDTIDTWQYWDGHNWNRIICDSSMNLTVSDDRVCLDEYDGNNYVTGYVGNHQYVRKILTIDGNDVKDQYLVIYNSQWEGSLPRADILTEDELRDHLSELNREVDDYMEDIKEL